jgi:hypothetical protein
MAVGGCVSYPRFYGVVKDLQVRIKADRIALNINLLSNTSGAYKYAFSFGNDLAAI